MKNKDKNIPPIITKYFLQFSKEDLDEAFAVLIKSVDGDSYYLTDSLVAQGVLAIELGEGVLEEVKKLTYSDIFEWYTKVR